MHDELGAAGRRRRGGGERSRRTRARASRGAARRGPVAHRLSALSPSVPRRRVGGHRERTRFAVLGVSRGVAGVEPPRRRRDAARARPLAAAPPGRGRPASARRGPRGTAPALCRHARAAGTRRRRARHLADELRGSRGLRPSDRRPGLASVRGGAHPAAGGGSGRGRRRGAPGFDSAGFPGAPRRATAPRGGARARGGSGPHPGRRAPTRRAGGRGRAARRRSRAGPGRARRRRPSPASRRAACARRTGGAARAPTRAGCAVGLRRTELGPARGDDRANRGAGGRA